MADLSKRIAGLSPDQRDRLLDKLREKGVAVESLGSRSTPVTIADRPSQPHSAGEAQPTTTGLKFSLFFFSAEAADQQAGMYNLLIESAKFADRNHFHAIWTPERHFNPFGGPYPNPAVLGAAIAMITERIQIRAGSVVAPLHHAIRIAEEWAVVDNLSQGRVGVSFASGWHPDDFVLSSTRSKQTREELVEQIYTIQRLWAGRQMSFPGLEGRDVSITMYPKPLQHTIPIWLTSSTNPQTWIMAGKIGANVLTSLLGQTINELEEKIALYRQALDEHGHDPASGQVTLMLHTFIGDDPARVKEQVRIPFSTYLRTHLSLYDTLAKSEDIKINVDKITDSDRDALVAFAFERYYSTSGLFGTPTTSQPMLETLHRIGVNEIACLVDFGIDEAVVLEGLGRLAEVQRRWRAASAQVPGNSLYPAVE